MSHRDGVEDAAYDILRASGLSREQCWAVIDCVRSEIKAPSEKQDLENRKKSGVRV